MADAEILDSNDRVVRAFGRGGNERDRGAGNGDGTGGNECDRGAGNGDGTGDGDDFGWLYRRYSTWVVAQARYRINRSALLRSRVQPEDIASEAWLVAFERRAEFDASGDYPSRKFMKFLSSTVANKLQSVVGMTQYRCPVEEPHSSLADDYRMTREIVRREVREDLMLAIEGLPEKEHDIIIVRGIEQNTVADTARMLGIETSNVTTRYARARALLAEKLGTDLRHEPLLFDD